MYNLTVAVAHTFFVGAGAWLVHNACRISNLADDWATKGAHIHTSNSVELAVRPGADGTISLKPVFSSTPAGQLKAAISEANSALATPSFRRQLYNAAARATEYLGKSSNPKWAAKSGETAFLMKALKKMGIE